MSTPSWTEYLDELTKHLEQVRALSEHGGTLPNLPEPPSDPIPDRCIEPARRLGEQFDKLAQEISERMAAMDRMVVSRRRSPHGTRRLSSYVETDG